MAPMSDRDSERDVQLRTAIVNAVADGLKQMVAEAGYAMVVPMGAYLQWAPRLVDLVEQTADHFNRVEKATREAPPDEAPPEEPKGSGMPVMEARDADASTGDKS